MHRYGLLARTAAPAAAALVVAISPAAATVEFLGASGTFYHFGSASLDGEPISFMQEPNTTNPISFDNGLLAYSASSEIVAATSPGTGSLQLNLSAVHNVAASVHPSAANGFAEAGAGLSSLLFSVRITGLPAVYTGDLTLDSLDAPSFPSGSEIPPGEYEFIHFLSPFEVHAYVSAVTGQSNTAQDGLSYDFLFVPIPAPCTAAALILLLAPQRRRR